MASYTERYIHAATRSLSPQHRDDLARELEASIGDAIAARTENGEPAEDAERDVLVELGDPAKLAADYADRPLTLIGPRYFLDWWRLLKLLLWIVLPIMVVVSVLVNLLAGENGGEIFGRTLGLTLAVGVHVCFWVTLGFAVLERTQPRDKNPMPAWTVDSLPEVRDSARLTDVIASLVFLVLAAAAIVWDRFVGFVPGQGEVVSIIDPALWPWWIVALIAVMVAEGVLAVAVYRTGRWTIGLAVVNSILALAVAVPTIWLIAERMLVNPAFIEVVAHGVEMHPIGVAVVSVAVGGIAAWDVIDGWYKTFRDRRA